MSSRSLLRLALAALLPAGSLGAQTTAFEGPPAGPGNVVVYPGPGSAGVRPPELQGIVLLPIDSTGRSQLTQFLPGQARLKNDLGLASRLVLPNDQGCLYRYRRSVSGGAEFGYFLVRPSGLGAFLASVPGTGPSGLVDPIPNPIAVSSSGNGMLFATTLAAGGDVFEIELGSGSVHELSENLPPLEILPQGLSLLEVWGGVLTTAGPLRFQRGGGNLHPVTLSPKTSAGGIGSNPGASAPPPLDFMGNGMASSADGSTLAMISGTSQTQAHVFAFHMSGSSMCVTDAPTAIADPGFGTHAGPTLALSPDGSRAAWKTTSGTGECFSRLVTPQQAPPAFHITNGPTFTDTLNDTGVIAFFDPQSVVLIVGEANGVGGVEKGDFYRATFQAGGGAPAMINLTNTSGDAVPPFLSKGDIETTDGIYQIPGKKGSIYFVPGSSNQGSVYRLDESTGNVQTIRSGIAALDFVEASGANFVVQVLHDRPARHELVRIPFDHALPASSLGFYSAVETVSSHTGNAAGMFAGLLNTAGGKRLFQLSIPNATGALLQGIANYGGVLGFGANGSAMASVDNASQAYLFSWAFGGGSALYGTGPLGSVILPGN